MRPLLNVLSKIATASSIADAALESMDGWDPESCRLYAAMSEKSMDAMKAFPGQLNPKEVRMIRDRLSHFFDKMGWDLKKKHAQTFMIFNTQQLEGIREELVAHRADPSRIKAIDDLILSEVAIYEHFAMKSNREYALCNVAGTRAADVWNEIWM